jgi:hypothetical protein
MDGRRSIAAVICRPGSNFVNKQSISVQSVCISESEQRILQRTEDACYLAGMKRFGLLQEYGVKLRM